MRGSIILGIHIVQSSIQCGIEIFLGPIFHTMRGPPVKWKQFLSHLCMQTVSVDFERSPFQIQYHNILQTKRELAAHADTRTKMKYHRHNQIKQKFKSLMVKQTCHFQGMVKVNKLTKYFLCKIASSNCLHIIFFFGKAKFFLYV